MKYKVVITKEVDDALDEIDNYCISHFNNYDYAQKVLNEILNVASYLFENAGRTPKYTSNLYKYTSPNIDYNFYYSINKRHDIVYIEKMLAFKQNQ